MATKEIQLYRVFRTSGGRIKRTEYVCDMQGERIRETIERFHEINGTDAISGKNIVPVGCEIKGQFS